MRGNITRRGKTSWRLKFDLGRDPATGKRLIRLTTVKGKRQDAEKELTRLLTAADNGTLVDPSKTTAAEYLRAWLDGSTGLAGKTLERYRQLVEKQVIPCLGAKLLQKLRPADIATWHATILKSGGKNGRPLSASTVAQAHRVLHRILAHATTTEVVTRNVASAISPPKHEKPETECLTAPQVTEVLAKMEGQALLPLVVLALGTGMRRGEMLALRWSDLNFDAATVKVERSLEETRAGLRFKAPKTRQGIRSISLPASVLEPLRAHWKAQSEVRLALGLGRPEPGTLIFGRPDGSPMSPVKISGEWRSLVTRLGLPVVTFHALRHTHASALIDSGLDVVRISRRLGHATPVVTLTVYAHLFHDTDTTAAAAIEAIMGTGKKR